MTPRPAAACFALALLAACGPEPARFAVPQATAGERVSIAFTSLEVRDVSLPTYAGLEEISVAQPDGSLRTVEDVLWADDPVRDVTLDLARNLATITGVTVAPEPWPFRSYADAVVDVRIEEMLADGTGTFRLSGQYFVAPEVDESRARGALFDLAVPYLPDGGVAAIAAARGQAIADLARTIATGGLR